MATIEFSGFPLYIRYGQTYNIDFNIKVKREIKAVRQISLSLKEKLWFRYTHKYSDLLIDETFDILSIDLSSYITNEGTIKAGCYSGCLVIDTVELNLLSCTIPKTYLNFWSRCINYETHNVTYFPRKSANMLRETFIDFEIVKRGWFRRNVSQKRKLLIKEIPSDYFAPLELRDMEPHVEYLESFPMTATVIFEKRQLLCGSTLRFSLIIENRFPVDARIKKVWISQDTSFKFVHQELTDDDIISDDCKISLKKVPPIKPNTMQEVKLQMKLPKKWSYSIINGDLVMRHYGVYFVIGTEDNERDYYAPFQILDEM
ncbi:hypothetical protein O9G_003943 [Rozella allomycis CSF55]|uniref:Uncharacterized protein n=1 Tax=Rozella allomycis (strain CSF55) TaxID=988480 RepID=A0A075APP5_ROZAC|nr:hypothetical protein O9G_003943 [Rozella allomycis CSF55]|eukprot:EPZ32096.1 hypothetical protein O9G_003943 [Rozella allomycis CSF55]